MWDFRLERVRCLTSTTYVHTGQQEMGILSMVAFHPHIYAGPVPKELEIARCCVASRKAGFTYSSATETCCSERIAVQCLFNSDLPFVLGTTQLEIRVPMFPTGPAATAAPLTITSPPVEKSIFTMLAPVAQNMTNCH